MTSRELEIKQVELRFQKMLYAFEKQSEKQRLETEL
jgi:hypothetical protein